jgi:large subunit ribosomal protein L9
MKIILLKDVPKLGRKFDVKNVADGYALNALIPKGLAESATEKSVKRLESLKAADVEAKKRAESELLKNLESLKGVSVKIEQKANDKGHLFAGISKEELMTEIRKQLNLNFELDPESVKLEKPIKEVGDHEIDIEAGGKKTKLKVTISAIK